MNVAQIFNLVYRRFVIGRPPGTLATTDIDSDEALYYFTSTMENTVFTFFVTFVKENGQWKIRTF